MKNANGSESMRALLEELVALAPKFFATKMVGATEREISQVQDAAGTILSDGHRTFLRFMGGTPAQQLNPFLNDRDFCTATLIRMHKLMLSDPPEPLPPGIVFFSSSDISGENIFLKHGETPSDDPLVGDLWKERWHATSTEHLEEYLRDWVLSFRMRQLKYVVEWTSLKGPLKILAILVNLGFQVAPSHRKYVHLVRGHDCVQVYDESDLWGGATATLAGDDLDELRRIVAIVADSIPGSHVTLGPTHESWRAPNE